MLQVFQETLPLANTPISAPTSMGGSFLNPIIMPFSINATMARNILECVFYIKNNTNQYFYKNVVVSLMKERKDIVFNSDTTADNTATISVDLNNIQFSIATIHDPISVTVSDGIVVGCA